MKKFLLTLSLVFVLVLSSFVVFAEPNQIIVRIDSVEVEFNQDTGVPFIDENNRTQVPFRATLEQYGAEVNWNNETRTAIATVGDITIEVPIGEYYILKNGEQISTDTVAVIKDNRTYLPIRPVIEAFGSEVQWDKELNTVVITKEPFDAKEVLMDAFAKSDEWENLEMKMIMDMSMLIPDETDGSLHPMNMQAHMNMTMFMEPQKMKLTTDLIMSMGGMQISQPMMEMYSTIEEDTMTTYMGTYDQFGQLTWVKMLQDNELYLESRENELNEMDIIDVKYYGKYVDENERSLLRFEGSISKDNYVDIFGDYMDTLLNSGKEEDLIAANILGSLDSFTLTIYVDEETGEITSFQMDLSSMVKSLFNSVFSGMDIIPEEELEALKDMNIKILMEVININNAEEFEIPEEALNAPELLGGFDFGTEEETNSN